MAGRQPALHTLVRAIAKLTPAQLRKVLTQAKAPSSGKLERLERQRDKHLAAAKKLERQIAELSGGNGAVASSNGTGKRGRRKGFKVSLATRRKMREAAKRRWGLGPKSDAPAPAATRTRKPFSAETRAKMAAAQQARWAKVKGTSVPKAEAKA